MVVLLPFDAHNHVHMGPTPPLQALGRGCSPSTSSSPLPNNDNNNICNNVKIPLAGMAIMSTHPRDYDRVWQLSQELPLQCGASSVTDASSTTENGNNGPLHIVPGFGIHPWWLAELTDDDWAPCRPRSESSTTPDNHNENDSDDSEVTHPPFWVNQLECRLLEHPNAIVGEIGLDGFHFDPQNKHELACPMERQVEAFVWQMQLAARHQRPVSIHTVQCFGPLMNALTLLKQKHKQQQRQQQQKYIKGTKTTTTTTKTPDALPPRMYFHAFGGKEGTVDQILALCGRKDPGKVYFGFAPVINFRSPKTAQVVQKVGLERIVLETDHEDAAYVQADMQQGIAFLAQTLGVEERIVMERTTQNAYQLYGITPPTTTATAATTHNA